MLCLTTVRDRELENTRIRCKKGDASIRYARRTVGVKFNVINVFIISARALPRILGPKIVSIGSDIAEAKVV